MSRCFPFPPPGYEKKARPDDPEVLKEEKNWEKKNKKEKKDKEKKEGKEKKEKDKSDGKNKEKKDRKEKHRDKKEKNRDKKKEKEDKKKDKEKGASVAKQSEGNDGDNLHKKELGKDNATSSNEKKFAEHILVQSGEKPIRNSLQSVKSDDSKFVHELGRRIRDEQKGTATQLAHRFTHSGQNGIISEGKGKNEDKKAVFRTMDGQEIKDDARVGGNAMAPKHAGILHKKVEGMPRQVEIDAERRIPEKEKLEERGNAMAQNFPAIVHKKVEGMPNRVVGKEKSEERGDKRKNKDRDREKKGHGKDKEREKEKKKEEKVKEKVEHVKTDIIKNELNDVFNSESLHLLRKDCENNAAAEAILKKRKDVEINGFLHDDEVRPNKILKPNCHPSIQNGRKLEISSDRQGTADVLKVVNKDQRVNGMVEARPMPPSMKPPLAIPHVDQISETSRKKSPHPDSKYLNRVLSVPKMDEWCDFDDQEWLFGNKSHSSTKPELGSSAGINNDLQVWADALHIESADVCALPYVIPY